ncbi:MAG: signal peptidase I [Acholeplasmataceae bacterium]|nr:signal peptidase I [Acholeplasmataceae bacterium]
MNRIKPVFALIVTLSLIVLYITLYMLGVSKLIMPFSLTGFILAAIVGVLTSLKLVKTTKAEIEKRPFQFEVLDWLRFLAISTIVIMTVFTFVIFSSSVSGDSMEDTLHDQDRIMVYLYRYQPERGHVIVLKVDRDTYTHIVDSHFRDDQGRLQDTVYFIKRVVGMPGDAIAFVFDEAIDGYRLYVNGEMAVTPEGKRYDVRPEAYDRINAYALDEDGVLKEGQYLLFGDHVEISGDSGDFGAFSIDHIIGRAIFRLWPFGGIS